jgi:hypothetical protein
MMGERVTPLFKTLIHKMLPGGTIAFGSTHMLVKIPVGQFERTVMFSW